MKQRKHASQENSAWGLSPTASLSVVMLGFRDALLLERALRSLVACTSNQRWELILVLNGASDAVRAFAATFLRENTVPVRLIDIPGCRPGAARNHGVRAARSDLLFFLDDDTESFQDILTAAEKIFQDHSIVAAGGANLTPPGSGALERATGLAMSTAFGAGKMSRRYQRGVEGLATEHDLILCNLVVRKSIFTSQRGFATHLVSNEENVLLQKLEESSEKLWRSPSLAVFHRRRRTVGGLWEQAGKYGAGRAQNLLLLPQTFHPRYFLPLAFFLYLLSLPIAFSTPVWWAPALLYCAVALITAARAIGLERPGVVFLQLLIFPVVHLGYGWGFLRAAVTWSGRRKELMEHAF